MKKYILIISLLAFVFSGFIAQESARNQTDDKGKKQGFWKKYDEMGYVRYEGHFKDDIPIGEFKYYYPDGEIRAISIIFDEGHKSNTRLFHRNGKLMAEGMYVDQKKDGVWKYYSEFDGILLSTESYVETLKQGVWQQYYPDKTIAETLIYENDVRQGIWRQFFTDATLKLEGTYLNDQKEGFFKIYHPNGQIEVSGLYHNGLKNGLWTEFDENGKKLNEKVYDMGKLVSEMNY